MGRFGKSDLRLPESLRGEMRSEAGTIFRTEDLAAALSGAKRVVSVGDMCTSTIVEMGLVPKLAVVDGSTQRGPFKEKIDGRVFIKLRVRNPAKTITTELWRAVEEAYAREGNFLIVVEGEEDLASLACIYMAPEGTTVIYGVPNRGVMVIQVGPEIRSLAGAVLAKMEE
jgi:hypothetical protein